jgi:hypothetical protein
MKKQEASINGKRRKHKETDQNKNEDEEPKPKDEFEVATRVSNLPEETEVSFADLFDGFVEVVRDSLDHVVDALDVNLAEDHETQQERGRRLQAQEMNVGVKDLSSPI